MLNFVIKISITIENDIKNLRTNKEKSKSYDSYLIAQVPRKACVLIEIKTTLPNANRRVHIADFTSLYACYC